MPVFFFSLFFLGVSIDALDGISFRVGYIITTIIIALVFYFFMGAWMLALTLVLLIGLQNFLALR